MKLLFVLLAALATLAPLATSVQAYECVKPWQKVSDDICLLLNSGIKSWNHANFLCKFYESDLLFINNEAEGKALTNYLNNLIRFRFNQKSYVWLDVKKNTDTNKWFSTRNNQTVQYTNWGSNARPDDARSTLNCACFKLKDGTWKDCDCETTNHFVCRKSDKSAAAMNQTVSTPKAVVEAAVEPIKPLSEPIKKTEGVKAVVNVNLADSSAVVLVTPETTVKAQAKISLPEVIDPVKETPKAIEPATPKPSGPAAVPVSPSLPAKDQAKISLPEVIDPVKETPRIIEADTLKISGPASVPVPAQLPPRLPAPVVISPVVLTPPVVGDKTTKTVELPQVPASTTTAVQEDTGLKFLSNDQVPEILPVQTVENILTPKEVSSPPTARIISKLPIFDEEESSSVPALDTADATITKSLEVKPEVSVKSNSLPTFDQLREGIRSKIESEIEKSSNLTPKNPAVYTPFQPAQPAQQMPPPVRQQIETYPPLTELDPQQFFDFTSQKQNQVPENALTSMTVVDQAQVPSETLDYAIVDSAVPKVVTGSVDELTDQVSLVLPQQPAQQNQAALSDEVSKPGVLVSETNEIDPREFVEVQERPRVVVQPQQQQQQVVPRILIGSEPSMTSSQNEIRMDGGALKLLRLLRPRNRFYRLKPEMLIEETPNLVRTLSGKIKPIENERARASVDAVTQVATSRANTADLSNEDKKIIISSRVMIDEEEKKDRNQTAKSQELETEKLISLLNEQSQRDPGKVVIRTSISKSTETFRLFECPSGYGYYSISNTNCNKYKRCDDWDLRNAVLTINKCSEGKVFSFTRLNCVNAAEYVCEDKVDKFVSFEENF